MTEEKITIGEVLQPRREKAQPAAHPELPYIGLEHVEAHTTRLLGSVPSHTMRSQANRFCSGDVLYSRLRPYLNKVWRADRDGLCSSEFIVLPENEFIDATFLCHRLSARDFVQFANSLNAGDRPRVDFDQISPFCLPPFSLERQRRIVAKVEELFSELDEGVANLKKARAQLAVYRQALLKHAFEGHLTADWRTQHAPELESADQLLARIRAFNGDFIPAREDHLSALPPVPSGWIYTYLLNLGALGRGKSKHRPRNDPALFGGPYPFLQTGEVKAANGTIRSYQQTYSEFGLRQSKLWPSGTLCITIAANIAETAFLGFDACFPDSVVGFTPNQGAVFSEFVELFIRSAKSRIAAYAPATAQKNINLETLENLLIPLPTIEEQREIVSTLGNQFSVIDALEADIDQNLQKAEALRQSILKKAFAGELVPQDSADEPAAALLARIRAERENTMKPSKVGKRTKGGRK